MVSEIPLNERTGLAVSIDQIKPDADFTGRQLAAPQKDVIGRQWLWRCVLTIKHKLPAVAASAPSTALAQSPPQPKPAGPGGSWSGPEFAHRAAALLL